MVVVELMVGKAGSGKTHSIKSRVLELLSAGKSVCVIGELSDYKPVLLAMSSDTVVLKFGADQGFVHETERKLAVVEFSESMDKDFRMNFEYVNELMKSGLYDYLFIDESVNVFGDLDGVFSFVEDVDSISTKVVMALQGLK